MVFGPALTVGCASLCEYVDVTLSQAEMPEDKTRIAHALKAASFPGLDILNADILREGDAKISKRIKQASYVAGIPHNFVAEELVAEEHLQIDDAFLQAQTARQLEVIREVKGIKKRMDVSARLKTIAIGDPTRALAEAGYVGDMLPLHFTVEAGPDGSVKPQEVIAAIFDHSVIEQAKEIPAAYVRTGLLDDAGLLAGRLMSAQDANLKTNLKKPPRAHTLSA